MGVVLNGRCTHAAMYEDVKEYLNWYDTRKDMNFAKDAPIIGLVLQRSHLVTGDEGHYSGVVSEMEARGAKVGSLPAACASKAPPCCRQSKACSVSVKPGRCGCLHVPALARKTTC